MASSRGATYRIDRRGLHRLARDGAISRGPEFRLHYVDGGAGETLGRAHNLAYWIGRLAQVVVARAVGF